MQKSLESQKDALEIMNIIIESTKEKTDNELEITKTAFSQNFY